MHSKIEHRFPRVDYGICIGCGTCVSVCPASPIVFELRDVEPGLQKSYVVHPEACIDCDACVDACPVEAIEMVNP